MRNSLLVKFYLVEDLRDLNCLPNLQILYLVTCLHYELTADGFCITCERDLCGEKFDMVAKHSVQKNL